MTPTASLTPAFTLDAPTATLSNSPPEPPLTLVYLESFVGESDPFAQLSGGLGAPIFVGSGYSLYLYPDAPSTQITSGSYADHAVQVSVQASTNARLSLRSSVSGAYRVTLTTDGRLVVSRDAVPLAETVLAPVASSWRLLRASVVGGVVGVSVDGREVVAVTDPDPLPAGTVMLTLPEGGLVDDLAIYVPGADALDSMQAAALGTGTPPRSPEGYFRTDAAIRQLLFNPDGSDAIFRGALRWNIHGFGFIGRGITNQNVVFSNLGYTRISPDGNFMLAHCRTLATHYNDICVQNFITGAIFPLTHDADADRHPVWFAGANGMEIVYASFPNTLGAFPEIRRIPFSSAAPATLPVPIRVAERCIDPVSVQVGTTPHLFCTRYQIAGWQGVRLLAPVFDATAQTNALTLDGDSLNLGVQLIDAAWTGTSLRLALTRYNSFGSDAALVGANSIIGLPALTTLRQIGEPNSALTYRALALSPNGRWFAFAFDSEYVGEGCGVCFNTFQSFVEDVDDPAHTRHSLSYNTFKTAPFFQWWRQTPSPELRLTLTLADGIDPAALVVGDSVTVIAQITNTGSAATTNPITLTLHVPDGIAAERAGANAVFLDIFQFILALLVGESDSAPLGENALGFSRTTTGVTLTYPFTVGALAPGESEVFAFTLDVTAPQVGDFLIEGTASTTFEPTSPVTATGVDAAAAVVSSEAEARLPVAVYQVIAPAAGQCASQVDGLNVRAAASTTAELLLSAYRGVLYLDGIYRAPPDTWYRVAGYLNGPSVTEFSSPGFGWVFGGPNAGYQGADPCNLPGNGVLANLILVDAFG
ncbi:MAG: hypothetical protein SGJ24_07160, partial [Chloroflexota bacterium]|nr:hypothetical protein [Chloroflexota bacterium]